MADLGQNKSKTDSLRIGLPGGPPIGHMDAKSENRTIKLMIIYFPVHFVMKFDSLEGDRVKKDYLHWVASLAYIGVNTNQAAVVSAVG